jgi:hypothetical protein
MRKTMSAGHFILKRKRSVCYKIFILSIFCFGCLGYSSFGQTASNGITKQGNDFRLGGTLTDINAVIDLGSSYFFKLKKSTQDYLIVTNGGNIGIGLSSPSYLLDVNGAIRIGSLTADPTGANGVLYYNSSTNKLKAYVNGSWRNAVMEGTVVSEYIQNQNSAAQTGNFWINGNGIAGTSLKVGGTYQSVLTPSQLTLVDPNNSGSSATITNEFGMLKYNAYPSPNPSHSWKINSIQLMSLRGDATYSELLVDGSGQFLNGSIRIGGYGASKANHSQFGYSTGTPSYRRRLAIVGGDASNPDVDDILAVTDYAGTANYLKVSQAGVTSLGGGLNLFNSSSDLTLSNGGLFYNSSIHQFRGYRNGAWKNFLMEGDVTGGSVSLPPNQIGYGNGSGITSSANLTYDGTYLIQGGTNYNTGYTTQFPGHTWVNGKLAVAGGATTIDQYGIISPNFGMTYNHLSGEANISFNSGVSGISIGSNSGITPLFVGVGGDASIYATKITGRDNGEGARRALTVNRADGSNLLDVWNNGKLYVPSLSTLNSSAPATTGTTKMVVTDDNGLLSYQDIPSGGSSSFIQNQNASAQTGNFWINGSGKMNSIYSSAGNFDGSNTYAANFKGRLMLGEIPGSGTNGMLYINVAGQTMEPFNISSDNRHLLSMNQAGTLSITPAIEKGFKFGYGNIVGSPASNLLTEDWVTANGTEWHMNKPLFIGPGYHSNYLSKRVILGSTDNGIDRFQVDGSGYFNGDISLNGITRKISGGSGGSVIFNQSNTGGVRLQNGSDDAAISVGQNYSSEVSIKGSNIIFYTEQSTSNYRPISSLNDANGYHALTLSSNLYVDPGTTKNGGAFISQAKHNNNAEVYETGKMQYVYTTNDISSGRLGLFVNNIEKLSLYKNGNLVVPSLATGSSQKMVVTDQNGLLSYQDIPSGGSGTASNGLTNVNGTTQLGGTLLQNTSINIPTNNSLQFVTNNTSTNFNTGANSKIHLGANYLSHYGNTVQNSALVNIYEKYNTNSENPSFLSMSTPDIGAPNGWLFYNYGDGGMVYPRLVTRSNYNLGWSVGYLHNVSMDDKIASPNSYAYRINIIKANDGDFTTSNPYQPVTNSKLFVIDNANVTKFSIGNNGQLYLPYYPNNASEDLVLTTDANGNVKLKAISTGSSVAINNDADNRLTTALGNGQFNAENNLTFDGSTLAINTAGILPSNYTGYKLAVNGNALFTRVKVRESASWPDYVFANTYKLPSLKEIEAFIKQHKHLPEVPSAEEVKKEGIDLGDNQAILLKKIEELTLYVIEQNKKIETLSKEVENLKKKN